MAHAVNEVFKERISKNLDWTKLPPPENRIMKHDRLGFNISSPMHQISKEAARNRSKNGSKDGVQYMGGSKDGRRASKMGGTGEPGGNDSLGSNGLPSGAMMLLNGSGGSGGGTWDHDPTLRIQNTNEGMGGMMQRRASREAGGIHTVPIQYNAGGQR